MGRGRDLSDIERVLFLNKIIQSWDSKKRRSNSGRRKIALGACEKA
jgi:hypothetical protein